MANLNITANQIAIRAQELIYDFGTADKAYWIMLLNEGENMDALEYAALGYLIAISDE